MASALAALCCGFVVLSGPVASLCGQESPPGREPRGDRGAPGRVVLRAPGEVKVAALDPAVVLLGLKWLQDHQDDDGKWDCDGFMKHDAAGEPCDGPGNAVHDVGVTGLALLAFLGDGDAPGKGPWRKTIDKAAAWLAGRQQPSGLIGVAASHDFVYGHAIATMALAEAFAATGDDALRGPAQGAVDYLEKHRNPFSVWRYQPRDNDNDTSVTTWCLLAYRAAADAGLKVNAAAFQLGEVWYDQVTAPNGRAGYSKRGEPSSRMPGDHATRYPTGQGEAMTAAALVGRRATGRAQTAEKMIAGADLLAAKLPEWTPEVGNIDPYYWYLGTRALAAQGGEHWQTWQRTLPDAVQRAQRAEGNYVGSWDPIGVWDEAGGRVYATAMYTMTMQVAAAARDG